MRTREEIQKDGVRTHNPDGSVARHEATNNQLLEVLLDIRDLLNPNRE